MTIAEQNMEMERKTLSKYACLSENSREERNPSRRVRFARHFSVTGTG